MNTKANHHRRPSSSSASFVRDGVFTVPILIDTREQRPFTFESIHADEADGGGLLAIQYQRASLKSGDYSLAGHETKVAVERKSKSDLFGTLGSGRRRFKAELSRLTTYRFAAIVVEAEWSEILSTPPRHSKLPPRSVFRTVIAWQQQFPCVHWWFVPSRDVAEVTTFRILERYLKENEPCPQPQPHLQPQSQPQSLTSATSPPPRSERSSISELISRPSMN